MPVPVISILGVAGIPTHRTSATRWLSKTDVPVTVLEGDKRRPEMVELCALPRSSPRGHRARHFRGWVAAGHL